MPSEMNPYGVRVIGSGPENEFVRERISLRSDFCVIDIDGVPLSTDASWQIAWFTGTATLEMVEAAFRSRMHVVLDAAIPFQSNEILRLVELADESGTIAVVDEPRRWDEDMLCARIVFDRGQFGRVQRVRLSIDECALPGEQFPRGVLRELGVHWLDQLLFFIDQPVQSVQLRRFSESDPIIEDGFLAVIDFQDGASAIIELQTRSLLSLRTGWLIEGTTGAYRAGRQYTKMPDGEIVDEPVDLPPRSTDPFFDALAAVLRSEQPLSTLAHLRHFHRVTELLEMLDQVDRSSCLRS